MKRQNITPASLASSATNSNRKGLQQYGTPEPWARALSAALPTLRRSIADLHCGNGSLLRGMANSTTREIMSLDIDPAAGPGSARKWTDAIQAAPPLIEHFNGDVLDLHPLLLDTDTRFDLLVANPPFSLSWPTKLLAEPLRKGLGKNVDSTHATLRMIPTLLSTDGEGVLIANQASLERIYKDHIDDFRKAWAWISVPSFFPGVDRSIRIGVLYFSLHHDVGPLTLKGNTHHLSPLQLRGPLPHLSPTSPDDLATTLDLVRRELFSHPCIIHTWDANSCMRSFAACGTEMERRRDPSSSNANVTLSTDGSLRTWVSQYQEKANSIPGHLIEFLRKINRKHPLELTLQRGSRMALMEAVESGLWTVSPDAEQAIIHCVSTFDRDRAPLSPILDVQRIGWIDDAEELLCISPFLHFLPGEKYKLSTETFEWKKDQHRPRYHAGKRDMETVSVRGTDLRITLHHPLQSPAHFAFNPDNSGTLHATHSLEVLAAHFQLPDVQDITSLHPEAYAANLALIDELELSTP